MESSAIKNWIPIKLIEEADELSCRWLYIGSNKFTEPFFDETIATCRQLKENGNLKRSLSSLSIFHEWEKDLESISPNAFIFHVSRCGSTLLSQLLSLQSANIVLSEVPFFDDILRYGNKNNCMKTMLPYLQKAIAFYAQKRHKESCNLFIKTDSWHIHFYKELRELYPNTPFIFLYRKPEEVLHSQQKKPGMQAIPGFLESSIFGFNADGITSKKMNEYFTMVLESYFNAFVEIIKTDSKCIALNYNEGGVELIKKTTAFAGTTIKDDELIEMKSRCNFHAKYPEEKFSEPKLNEEINPLLKNTIKLYYELENLNK